MNVATKRVLLSGLGYCAVLLLIQIVSVALVLIMGGVEGNFNFIASVATALAVGAPALVFQVFARGRGLRMLPPGWSIILVVPLALAGLMALNAMIALITMGLQAIGPYELESAVPIPDTIPALAASFLVIGLFPAVFEEFMFRGCLQPALEHRGMKFSVVFSGTVFALMHGQIAALPAHLALGVMLGYLYVTSKSIWVPIAYHFTHNAASMAVAYAAVSYLDGTGTPDGGAVHAGVTSEAEAILSSQTYQVFSVFAVLVVFSVVFAGLLAAYRAWRRAELRKRPPESAREWESSDEKVRGWAWIPYIAGMVISLALYAVITLQSYGLLLSAVI